LAITDLEASIALLKHPDDRDCLRRLKIRAPLTRDWARSTECAAWTVQDLMPT